MDFNLFNLKNLIRLFHLIYYNTEDDNAFIFLNTYVCDEFAHLIPQNIGKLFNELKVENVPIDMKRYVNVDRGFLERNGKIRNEKIYNKKVEIRNKLNELLILCDEETASKYSAKLLIKCVEGTTKRKLSGSKVTHNVKEDKLPEYFNDITYTPPSCIVDKTQNLIRTSKILVPGTPESILKKREFRKRKIFFNISEKRF
uniref:Uncharacterized protein n=1 Tax=Parastrongyloides trichosuri TaxID=131310 RepID=A0A0N4ZLK7_PARTI